LSTLTFSLGGLPRWVHAFAWWGIHTFGTWQFGIVVFPPIFLGAYLYDRGQGG
jgi:hypothetical protein